MTMHLPLTAEKARIFRIIHRDNLPWTLKHGLHCRNSHEADPDFVNIGNPDLIDKRHRRQVPIPPGGTLSDYVPFYFTPRTPMLLNIKTGWNGVRQRKNNEIVILVSSLLKIREAKIPFIFTDQHAYVQTAKFYNDLARLDSIDWKILQQSDFKNDLEDMDKPTRYQAEALVYEHVPAECLLGLACNSSENVARITQQLQSAKMELKVIAKSEWYF